jgi:hypothetical protein
VWHDFGSLAARWGFRTNPTETRVLYEGKEAQKTDSQRRDGSPRPVAVNELEATRYI